MRQHSPAQETLDSVNDLINGATAEGGYCLGVVCALSWARGREPSRQVLELAVKMLDPSDAVELCEAHLKETSKK